MPHDQLWKDVLWLFFREFMELFFPDVAERLDFSRMTQLDKEMFTDLPAGSRREPDVLVEVGTKEGDVEIVLVHIEVQAEHAADVPARMWEYYSLLRLRKREPVLPLAVYLCPGTGGLRTEKYTEGLWGRATLRFEFDAVGLPDMPAEEYLERENVLAPALSALMRSSSTSRVMRKLRAYQRLTRSGLNEARQWLLLSVVDQYLVLSEAEGVELDELLEPAEQAEVRSIMLAYEERGHRRGYHTGHEEGLAAGLEQGLEQGREQGREQGLSLGYRQALLRIMQLRFGDLPASIVNRIEAIEDTNTLGVLSDRVFRGDSLEEMGLKPS